MNKKAALNRLRRKIIEELYVKKWHEVWFFPNFPRKYGVSGWEGTDPIIFIGLNPSTGHFPSRADCLFYGYLGRKKLRFHHAHITDLYKIRASASGITDDMRNGNFSERLNRKYLLKEIDILKPRLVVALGKRAFEILKKWIPKHPQWSLDRIRHYSWAKRYGHDGELLDDMMRIRRLYDSILENQAIRKGILPSSEDRPL
jgi:hypothetical protein